MVDLDLLSEITQITAEAGREIMVAYRSGYQIEKKADDSPLTTADRRSHDLIYNRLDALTPDIPLVSEESVGLDTNERLKWGRLWLIDPLDGTKEFIKRNGEFTVNIALIEDGQPVLGVVHTPARRLFHFAASGRGAWCQAEGHTPEKIRVRPYRGGTIRMATSRSHSGEPVENFRSALESQSGERVQMVVMGSSLKICLVAAGQADVYPRLGPTSEWDTGAAHCVLNEAGGSILNCDGHRLVYNKNEMRNPWFIAVGDPSYNWIERCPRSPL
jgi:3'(2'), 5'-bisphosphate nucleotidase